MTEVITDPTPPILHGPSDKEKKYDRQLRLWAASGQQALEDAHILLINSGSGTVGVETLKNLVLPGIGKFTIADEETVVQADLGVNFFLDEDCLGKPRAECCVKLLQELNPDVNGDWFPKNKRFSAQRDQEETIEQLFNGTMQFTMILYTAPISRERMELVLKYSQQHNIPAIAINSAGFYSYFRINLPGNFPIVDTHPDSTATTDLRLLTPWKELSQFAISLTENIESLSAHEHGHIPYVALLLHYLTKWKEDHGSLPSTYKEKTAFRSTVASGARTDTPEGGEENFEEAVAAVLKTISAPGLPSSVKEVFEYTPNETEAASSFWVIADAIKQFYKKHNALPLPGSVPDMKAQSTVYVQLQNIYKTKARQDVAEVLETVQSHPKGKNIDLAEVEIFCKNAAFIKLIRGSQSSEPSPSNIKVLAEREFENDNNAPLTAMPLSLFPIYLSLSATTFSPTSNVSDIIGTIKNVFPEVASTPRIIEAAEEVARANGGELHNISSLTGGMVAQEVIKVITKQYIPIDNTCIFDGITSRTQVLRI